MATQSDFWFTVDASGVIGGFATSTYQLKMDDGKLRTRLAWIRSAGGSAVGVFAGAPAIGALLGAGTSTKEVLGLTAMLDEPMPVRSAALRVLNSGM